MPSSADHSDPRRRTVRHRNGLVSCPFGDVEDISAGGVRISGRGRAPLRVGDACTLRLVGLDGALNVKGTVVRTRRRGLFGYEIAISFGEVRPRLRRVLESMAEYGIVETGEVPTTKSPKTTERQQRPADAKPLRAEMVLPDLYAMFNVAPTASINEINAAYRRLVRQFHPDVTTDPAGSERFIELRKAVTILRDPEMRRRYDERRAA